MKARQRGLIAVALAAVVCLALPVLAGGGPAVAGANCTNENQPPRLIPTDDGTGHETQYCLDGQWTTVLVDHAQDETTVIRETVKDPTDLKLGLTASDFFDLKNYDPWKVIKVFNDAAAAGTKLAGDDETQMRLSLAYAQAQALLARQNFRNMNQHCSVRSVLYSELQVRTFRGWLPPENTGFAGQPTQITYAFEPTVTTAEKIAILNAIEQYPVAVAVAAGGADSPYPQLIVPRDPADTRPPTIWFNGDESALPAHAMAAAKPSFTGTAPGAQLQWVSGEIRVRSSINPMTVGHEIGHVLGINHLPADVNGTMNPTGPLDATPGWNPSTSASDVSSVAFDPCMFIPVDRPML
ncbi:MAG: hypothetical protein JWQ19_1400 [Subtercola sp.]|nr:hypothetical protein [Subtercola sp.]